MAAVVGIAKYNVAVLLVGLYLRTDFLVANSRTNTNPVALHTSTLTDEPRLLVRRIDESEHRLSLAAVGHNGIGALFGLYLIDNV